MTLLIGFAIVAFAGMVLFQSQLGVLLKGFYGIFVKDLAQTPEGAEAIYQEAINKAQDRYNKASDALQKMAGQLHTARAALKDAQARLKDCEMKCEKLAAAKRFDEVELYAQERILIQQEVEDYQAAVEDLLPLEAETKEILSFAERELAKLKKEKVMVVNNLKRNIQVKEMYDTMDQLKRNSNLDKMMGHVRDGAREKKEMAVGARVLHDNKLSTKVSRADTTVSKLGSDDYVSKLKAKYGNPDNGFEVKERIKN